MLDDPDRIGSALRDWLAERHPERMPVRLGPLVRSAGGSSNVTLLSEIEWRVEGRLEGLEIVLRLQPSGLAIFPGTDIARQYRVMERLADSAVPVPRLLGLERDPGWLGAPFFLMERVAGRVPSDNPPYCIGGWLHDLDPAAQRRHWLAGIETLGALARVDWRARGFDDLLPGDGRSPLRQQLDHYRDAVAWAESLARPYPHLHGAYEWLVANQPGDEPLGLVWGDAKLGNCVFRDERVVAALDWEETVLGNPVDDLAWWLMLDDSFQVGYGLPRLPGFPSREETVAHWERASGLSARDLDYYAVFGAWRMAFIMARVGTLFAERGLVPREANLDVENGGSRLLALHRARLGF